MQTDVTNILNKNQIKYTLKKHSNKALTCESAAKERKCKVSQIVKTMVGKDDKGNFHVSLIPGNRILKIKKVRKEAGGLRISLVDPLEISQELGLSVGAISPLIFPDNTQFYIDSTILNEKYVTISAGNPFAGVELLSSDLVNLVQGKICDIISSSK